MKSKTILLIALAALILQSCGGTESETNKDGNTDSTETVIETINEIANSDFNWELGITLQEIQLPELNISVGLPFGWTALKESSDPEANYFAIGRNNETVFYIFDEGCVADYYDGFVPANTQVMRDNYDETAFLMTEDKKIKSGATMRGLVFQYEGEDAIRFEYYVDLNNGEFINTSLEIAATNIDTALTIINSIKPL